MVKNLPAKCRRQRRCGFDSWVRKVPQTRAQQPTPVFLPGESHRQRSLEGYSLQHCKQLYMTEATQHATPFRQLFVTLLRQHHQLNGHEFVQTPGDSGRWRSLTCYSPQGHKESDMPQQLNSNESAETVEHITRQSSRQKSLYVFPVFQALSQLGVNLLAFFPLGNNFLPQTLLSTNFAFH